MTEAAQLCSTRTVLETVFTFINIHKEKKHFLRYKYCGKTIIYLKYIYLKYSTNIYQVPTMCLTLITAMNIAYILVRGDTRINKQHLICRLVICVMEISIIQKKKRSAGH